MDPQLHKSLGKGAPQDDDCNPSKRSRLDFNRDSENSVVEPKTHSQDSDNDKDKDEMSKINLETSLEQQLPDDFVIIPLNSLPAVQAVFSIENIQKKIFSFSSPQDLLQFRLVSRAWRQYATNDTLLGWKQNSISAGKELNQLIRPLLELTELMDSTGQNAFPCSRFNLLLTSEEKLEEMFQTFVTKHGFRMQYLNLRLLYFKCCNDVKDEFHNCSHMFNWAMELVTDLLHKQAPNLLKLWIEFHAFYISNQERCKLYPDIHINSIKNGPPNFHSKLQLLDIDSNNYQLLFDSICKLVPDVKELKCGNLRNYLEPTNRLHLLKKIWLGGRFSFMRQNFDQEEPITILKRIANVEGDLQLKEITFGTDFIGKVPSKFSEITDILNKLLDKCRCSLKKLQWSPASFLSGLKIPQMPNVGQIHFCCKSANHVENEAINFFPRGMRISECFPNLRTVQFTDHSKYPHYLAEGRFDLGCEHEVFHSVKKVLIMKKYDPAGLKKLQRLFSNAVIDQHWE